MRKCWLEEALRLAIRSGSGPAGKQPKSNRRGHDQHQRQHRGMKVPTADGHHLRERSFRPGRGTGADAAAPGQDAGRQSLPADGCPPPALIDLPLGSHKNSGNRDHFQNDNRAPGDGGTEDCQDCQPLHHGQTPRIGTVLGATAQNARRLAPERRLVPLQRRCPPPRRRPPGGGT